MVIQRLDANYWSIVAWNPNYSPIFLHFKLLMDDDFISQIQPKHYHGTDYHFVTYGLAPCQYDIYIYCKYGIVPIMILSFVAILLRGLHTLLAGAAYSGPNTAKCYTLYMHTDVKISSGTK